MSIQNLASRSSILGGPHAARPALPEALPRASRPRHRSGEVIEPLLSDQWFVSTEVMAQRALDAVESGDIKIQPERFVKCLDLNSFEFI